MLCPVVLQMLYDFLQLWQYVILSYLREGDSAFIFARTPDMTTVKTNKFLGWDISSKPLVGSY